MSSYDLLPEPAEPVKWGGGLATFDFAFADTLDGLIDVEHLDRLGPVLCISRLGQHELLSITICTAGPFPNRYETGDIVS